VLGCSILLGTNWAQPDHLIRQFQDTARDTFQQRRKFHLEPTTPTPVWIEKVHGSGAPVSPDNFDEI